MWNVPTRIFNVGNPQLGLLIAACKFDREHKDTLTPYDAALYKYKAKPSSNWNPFGCLQLNVGNLETILSTTIK